MAAFLQAADPFAGVLVSFDAAQIAAQPPVYSALQVLMQTVSPY
jgi:hypothetical protein